MGTFSLTCPITAPVRRDLKPGWIHVLASYSAGGFWLAVNGQTQSYFSTPLPALATLPLTAQLGSADWPVVGRVDEFTIWQSALSSANVAWFFNDGFGQDLVSAMNSTATRQCAITQSYCVAADACVDSIDDCRVNRPCDNASYVYCATIGECRASFSECAPPTLSCPGAYACWNGLCVSSQQECEAVPSCPPDRPQRCADGTCVGPMQHCNSSSSTVCSTGTVACPTGGVCAARLEDCAEYNGCPQSNPISCADGTCVSDWSACLCANNATLVRCFDGQCRAQASQCGSQAPYRQKPLELVLFPNGSSFDLWVPLDSWFGLDSSQFALMIRSRDSFQLEPSCNFQVHISAVADSSIERLSRMSISSAASAVLSSLVDIKISSCARLVRPLELWFSMHCFLLNLAAIPVNGSIGVESDYCLASVPSPFSTDALRCDSTGSLSLRRQDYNGSACFVVATVSHLTTFVVVKASEFQDVPTDGVSTTVAFPVWLIGLLVALAACLVLVLCTIVALCLVHGRSRQHHERRQSVFERGVINEDAGSVESDAFLDGCVLKEAVGGGQFGTVFKGEYDGNPVAFKKLDKGASTDTLLQEATILRVA
jgi:hypothetical protein